MKMYLTLKTIAILFLSTAFAASSDAQLTAPAMRDTAHSVNVINAKQAHVITKTGMEFTGAVVQETDDGITMQSKDSAKRFIKLENIKEITYYDPAKTEDFAALGAVLGTPGGLNLVLGYHWKTFGLRLSGMYLGKISGSQLEFSISVGRDYESSKYLDLGII